MRMIGEDINKVFPPPEKDLRIIYNIEIGGEEYSITFHTSYGLGIYEEHSHDDLFEVYCLMSGEAELIVENEVINLETRVAGAYPGQKHIFKPKPETPVRAIIVTTKKL